VALVAFTAVGIWATRPLVWHLRDHSLVASELTAFDVPLNAWILAWVSRALVTQPWRLFAANIYHPEPQALAYTEHMLGSAPFFGPPFLLTGNPALALNVMILAGLVLSALGTYWVTWRWTGSRAAAAFAGLAVGFQPAQVRAFGPNLLTTQYLPVVLLCLDRVLAGGRLGPTLGLAAALTGQCLASYYYAYPTMLATAAAVLAVCVPRATRPPAAAVARVFLAVAVAAAVLVAASVPYFDVAARGTATVYQLTRVYEGAAVGLAQLAGPLRHRLGPAALGLALVGAAAALPRGASPAIRRRVLVLALWVAVGVVLAGGEALRVGDLQLPLPGRLLDQWAPGFAALRDRRRLLVVVPVALGVLAGLGIAALARAAARPRLAAAVLAAAALGATAAATDLGPCRLMRLPTGSQVPAVYRDLARREPGPVLELPVGVTLHEVPSAFRNTWYEYFSVFHWRPLLNGYASYWPPRLEATFAMARALPEPRALANLAGCHGVRWVIAHTDAMRPDERAAFGAAGPGLREVARFGGDVLYVAAPPAAGAPCPGTLAADAATTLEGTPLAPLPPSARRAAIESVDVGPALAASRGTTAVRVRLRNAGTAPWPAVAVDETHLVRVSYAWQDGAGAAAADARRLWTRLPADLRPGEAIEVPLALRPPPRPGTYRLQLVVRQGYGAPFELTGEAAAPRTVTIGAAAGGRGA
jgi:hypothetical protein